MVKYLKFSQSKPVFSSNLIVLSQNVNKHSKMLKQSMHVLLYYKSLLICITQSIIIQGPSSYYYTTPSLTCSANKWLCVVSCMYFIIYIFNYVLVCR